MLLNYAFLAVHILSKQIFDTRFECIWIRHRKFELNTRQNQRSVKNHGKLTSKNDYDVLTLQELKTDVALRWNQHPSFSIVIDFVLSLVWAKHHFNYSYNNIFTNNPVFILLLLTCITWRGFQVLLVCWRNEHYFSDKYNWDTIIKT